MQPRILHMVGRLELDPREVPASNVVFVRSRGEAGLRGEKTELLDACWPIHEAVIRALGVRAIVCFGGTAGRWVRERVGADQLFDRFVETNARGWTSEAHRSVEGRAVVTVTHPGRADWRNPVADPTALVRRAIASTI
jgi:uracil-DNA glycosylase